MLLQYGNKASTIRMLGASRESTLGGFLVGKWIALYDINVPTFKLKPHMQQSSNMNFTPPDNRI